MGCYNCGTEFTLKQEEEKCDKCGKIVNFICHRCHEWFSIEGIRQCVYCGFYTCPNCNICGFDCDKEKHISKIIEIIKTQNTIENKAKQITEYFGDVKIGKERRECLRGVSISYAKTKIKSCIVRLMGYRIKNQKDLDKFKERYETICDIPLGEKLTINKIREDGSYGQEFRDVFNYAVCMGKFKKTKHKNKEGEEYELFERVEEATCPYLDLKDLIIKICPNKKCQIGKYPLNETYCLCPECKHKKGKKKGQQMELKLKISNKDICQLKKGEFLKDGEDELRRRNEETN